MQLGFIENVLIIWSSIWILLKIVQMLNDTSKCLSEERFTNSEEAKSGPNQNFLKSKNYLCIKKWKIDFYLMTDVIFISLYIIKQTNLLIQVRGVYYLHKIFSKTSGRNKNYFLNKLCCYYIIFTTLFWFSLKLSLSTRFFVVPKLCLNLGE